MTPNNFATVRDILRYAITRFNTAKLFSATGPIMPSTTAYLILHTLKLPLDQLEPFMDARLLQGEIDNLLRVIDKRTEERIPAAYLTNEAWLGGYRFYVDERVIVPRSFLAELIPEHFAPWLQDADAVQHALDLCTGSGCLPILLADAFPQAQIDAVDISADALAVARLNVRRIRLGRPHHAGRIRLVQQTAGPQIRSDHQQPALCERRFDGQAAAGISARTATGTGRWR